MVIRGIIALSAITPYIVGSALLFSTACAPKSRHRGPVQLIKNLGKTETPAQQRATDQEKAALQAQIDELKKQIQEKAGTEAQKQEIENLQKMISILEFTVIDQKTSLTLKIVSSDGEKEVLFEGGVANINEAVELTSQESLDLKVTVRGTSDQALSLLTIKKGETSVSFTIEMKGVDSIIELAALEAGKELSEDSKSMKSKLEKLNKVAKVDITSLQDGSQSIILVLADIKVKEDKTEEVSFVQLNGANEVGAELSVVKNEGFDVVTSGEVKLKSEKSLNVELTLNNDQIKTATLLIGDVSEKLLERQAQQSQAQMAEQVQQQRQEAIAADANQNQTQAQTQEAPASQSQQQVAPATSQNQTAPALVPSHTQSAQQTQIPPLVPSH